MAISYIGAGTGTTTATLPSHQAGDLIFAFAFIDGSNTAATLPGGWTNIANAGANTCSGRVAYKIAASSSETSGTWTSATSLIILVYRSTVPLTIGANATNTGSSSTVNYPAVSLQKTDGTSWVVGFAGHRSVNTALETPPTGMTNRSTVLDATDEAAAHDTNGGVASWSSTNVSAGGTASGYRSYMVEIREARVGSVSLSGAGAASLSATAKRPALFSCSAAGTFAIEITIPPVSGYRVTEDGDRRVTEDSYVRITEHFLPAVLDWSGPAGTMFLAAKRLYAVFGLTSAGSISLTADILKFASLVGEATSSSSFDNSGTSESLLAWDGAGSASFFGLRRRAAAADFVSGGSYFVAAGYTRDVGVDWMAVGSVLFRGGFNLPAILSFDGSAAFAAKAGLTQNAAFDFAAKSNTNTRVAEDGRRRITQSSDIRITSYRAFVAGKDFPVTVSMSGAGAGAFDGELTITVSNVDVRFGGVWYDNAETFVKDDSAWKQAIKIYAKDNGVWKLTR